MGAQSSRIIWGRVGEEESKLNVTLYDPAETIYVKSNMALVRETDPDKAMSTIVKVYVCEVAEAAGEWDQHKDDWREVKSIYAFDPKKEYAKGARCIYDNYLWSCLLPITKEVISAYATQGKLEVLVPHDGSAYWEHVKQTVGVAYHALDHKEVYYDDGKNDVKWHKAMWFVPDEDWFDQEHEEEITAWNPDRQYEHVETKETGDMVIYTINLAGHVLKRLYECRVRHTTQGDKEWHPTDWTLRQDVEEWDNHRSYLADEYAIHADTYVSDADIITFGQNSNVFTFKPGDKVIYPIDPQDKNSPVQRIQYEYNSLPAEIRNKVENVGKIVNAVYVLCEGITDPNMGNFQRSEWALTNEAFDLFLGEDYLTDDEVIWSKTATDETSGSTFVGVLGVFKAKENFTEIKADETPSANPSKWGTIVNHEQRSVPIDHLYRAKKDLTVGENLIWRPENWVIATQQIKPPGQDLGWYGWIWKKLGVPGSDGYIYCFTFPSIGPYDDSNSKYYQGRQCEFVPQLSSNTLEAKDIYHIYLDASRHVTGVGFTDFKNYLLTAFGFVALADIGSSVYSNYIYIYVQDKGWIKTELNNWYDFRSFTPTGGTSFFALGDDGNTYKVNVIPGEASTETQVDFGTHFSFGIDFFESMYIASLRAEQMPIICRTGLNCWIDMGFCNRKRYVNGDLLIYTDERFDELYYPYYSVLENMVYAIQKDELLGSEIIANIGYTYTDIWVYNLSADDLNAFLAYWGLTYSDSYVRNVPMLNKNFSYYTYEFTSFKGDLMYVFRMAIASDKSYSIAKLLCYSKAALVSTTLLFSLSQECFGFAFYGRFETDVYGITAEGSYPQFNGNSGVWKLDLTSKTMTQIIQVSTLAEYEAVHKVANIPYVNGYNFKFENNVVESLTLYFAHDTTLSIPDRHEYRYDSMTHELKVFIPIDDRNLFSINTGLPTQATTYGAFFRDRISVGSRHYGIYVYIPNFKGYNSVADQQHVSYGSFFWMSYGYNDYINGPFIGGAGTDDVSF